MTSSDRPNRSAHATIAGFDYQFDLTILEVLGTQSDNAVIDVEGIEDFDVHESGVSTAVQVKYLQAQKYTSPKALREPIKAMLLGFKPDEVWQYTLHVYFGDGHPPERLTVDELKNCLTRRDRKLKVDVLEYEGRTDEELAQFCKRLTIRQGAQFAEQEALVLDSLKSQMGCLEDEALVLHLPRARDYIRARARAPQLGDRRVTKADLKATLSVREMLYQAWHADAVGQERYMRAQTKALRDGGFNKANLTRALIAKLDDGSLEGMVELCKHLAGKYKGRMNNARPWLLGVDSSKELLDLLKSRLIEERIRYDDGYESVKFSPELFDSKPVVTVRGASNMIKDTSHSIRLVSTESLRKYSEAEYKIHRMISYSTHENWHESFANQVYRLRNFDQIKINQLMENIA